MRPGPRYYQSSGVYCHGEASPVRPGQRTGRVDVAPVAVFTLLGQWIPGERVRRYRDGKRRSSSGYCNGLRSRYSCEALWALGE